ncbi:MAG TPA: glycosyltransferase family 2 protein [Patescibacteria group bacterium]
MSQGVSIVIPSYNCKKVLFRLLLSLKKSDYKKFEVLVVDNGSRDNTLKDGKKKFRWVRWIDGGQENIGQTGTYNLGFAHAKKGNHIMMIDSDVVVDKKMINNLVGRLDKDKKIGIVTPMVLYLNDKNWVNQAGASVDLTTGKVSIGWGAKENYLEAKEVQNSGTVMLFRNKVVEKIGGFDDWFLCYFDPDYCLRAKKAGFSTWYEPSAICYHDQSKDPTVWRPRVLSRAYLLGRNRTLFMRRHGNVIGYLLFLPLLFGYYFVETLRFGIFPKWIELVRGTVVGFFYPLNKGNKIPLPSLK